MRYKRSYKYKNPYKDFPWIDRLAEEFLSNEGLFGAEQDEVFEKYLKELAKRIKD